MKAVQVRTISIMMVALLAPAGIAAAQEAKIEPGSETANVYAPARNLA